MIKANTKLTIFDTSNQENLHTSDYYVIKTGWGQTAAKIIFPELKEFFEDSGIGVQLIEGNVISMSGHVSKEYLIKFERKEV